MHVNLLEKLNITLINKTMQFEGNKKESLLWEGVIYSEDGTFKYPIKNGITILHGETFNETINALKKIGKMNKKQIEIVTRNWITQHRLIKEKPESPWVSYSKSIAEEQGMVLDIAVGYGGGFTPGILAFNPKATIIMNDIDPEPLAAWRTFFNKHNIGKNTSMIVFDARRIPFKDSSIDIVVSSGGIGNIPQNHIVLTEIKRVLKHDGRLYIADGILLKDDLIKLPEEIYTALKILNPLNEIGYEEYLKELGFKIIESKVYGGRELDPEEGDLPKLAHEHNVTIRFKGIYIKAIRV